MVPLEEPQQAARDIANCFNDSWNRQDGRAYGAAYWEDAELVDPTGTVWNGREAIEQMHVGMWSGPARGTRVNARVRRVRALSPTLAVIDLDVEVSGFAPPPPGAMTGADGSIAARLKHVIEKRGKEWKIVASQNTFVAGGPRQ